MQDKIFPYIELDRKLLIQSDVSLNYGFTALISSTSQTLCIQVFTFPCVCVCVCVCVRVRVCMCVPLRKVSGRILAIEYRTTYRQFMALRSLPKVKFITRQAV